METSFGVPSVTRPGDLDYTTKKGDMVYHPQRHFKRKTYKPYSYHKGSRSKTRKGRKNFSKKRRKGKYVRKSYKPYSKKRKTKRNSL